MYASISLKSVPFENTEIENFKTHLLLELLEPGNLDLEIRKNRDFFFVVLMFSEAVWQENESDRN